MVNLLRNALQATEPGQTIRVDARAAQGDTIAFAVEDEGTGIPEHLARRVFDPFFSTKGEQGMGMGLDMARLIAESHGGTLRLVAPEQMKRGTRFELLIPAAPRLH